MTQDFDYERRQHDRLFHQTRVQVTTAETQDSVIASTVNLSDGGILLKYQLKSAPKLGDIMYIQALDFSDAPIKKVIVRRISDQNEIGVEFID